MTVYKHFSHGSRIFFKGGGLRWKSMKKYLLIPVINAYEHITQTNMC